MHVCVFVFVLVMTVNPTKMAEPIEINLGCGILQTKESHIR